MQLQTKAAIRLAARQRGKTCTSARVASIIWPNSQCINPRCPMVLFTKEIADELNEFFKGEE
jgi:hypothetical protein